MERRKSSVGGTSFTFGSRSEYLSKYCKLWRQQNKEHVKKHYMKIRDKKLADKKKVYDSDPEKYRKMARQRRLKNLEEARKKDREKYYMLRDTGKLSDLKDYRDRWRKDNKNHINKWKKREYQRNPEYRKKVLVACKTRNKFGKAKICERCGSSEKVEHHHIPPYRFDRFVDLCINCHREEHMKRRGEKNGEESLLR